VTNLEAVTDAVRTHIAGFKPAGRHDAETFFGGLSELVREFGTALNAAAENMSDQHIHSDVLDALREAGRVISSVSDRTDDVFATHVQRHEVWRND
jgi:hypothetical protein